MENFESSLFEWGFTVCGVFFGVTGLDDFKHCSVIYVSSMNHLLTIF